MGNPQSKPCYFTGNYDMTLSGYNGPKVRLRDSIATVNPLEPCSQTGKVRGGNYHCWIKRGSMIIDPTRDDVGPPDEAASPERLYFPFDTRLQQLLSKKLAKDYRIHCGSTHAMDMDLSERSNTGNYPWGQCYPNCIAYQRAHRDCTVVIGAVGYKTFEWKEKNGYVLEGVFDKRKPLVMLDQGL